MSATQASPKIIFFFPGSLFCFRTARAGTLLIIAGHNGLLNLPKSIKILLLFGFKLKHHLLNEMPRKIGP